MKFTTEELSIEVIEYFEDSRIAYVEINNSKIYVDMTLIDFLMNFSKKTKPIEDCNECGKGFIIDGKYCTEDSCINSKYFKEVN